MIGKEHIVASGNVLFLDLGSEHMHVLSFGVLYILMLYVFMHMC